MYFLLKLTFIFLCSIHARFLSLMSVHQYVVLAYIFLQGLLGRRFGSISLKAICIILLVWVQASCAHFQDASITSACFHPRIFLFKIMCNMWCFVVFYMVFVFSFLRISISSEFQVKSISGTENHSTISGLV